MSKKKFISFQTEHYCNLLKIENSRQVLEVNKSLRNYCSSTLIKKSQSFFNRCKISSLKHDDDIILRILDKHSGRLSKHLLKMILIFLYLIILPSS